MPKTITSVGIEKIGRRFADSIDHAAYTLNGAPKTVEPFRKLVTADTVAEIRGSEWPGQVVILGAHLDSWDLGTGVTSTGGMATQTPAEKMFLYFLLRWCSSISTKPRGLQRSGTAATASTPLNAGRIIANLNGSLCSLRTVPSSLCSAACTVPAGKYA